MKKTIASLLAAITMSNLQAGSAMKTCCPTNKSECAPKTKDACCKTSSDCTKKTDDCCKTDKSCKGECVATGATKATSKRTKTTSGLEYEVLKAAPADARAVKKGDVVKAHYTGWLADENGNPRMDKKFDSSVDRGQPFSVKAGAGMVIRGWDETLVAMKVGEKRRIVLPPHLAYGNRAVGGMIPANSTLVFDLEILSVQ